MLRYAESRDAAINPCRSQAANAMHISIAARFRLIIATTFIRCSAAAKLQCGHRAKMSWRANTLSITGEPVGILMIRHASACHFPSIAPLTCLLQPYNSVEDIRRLIVFNIIDRFASPDNNRHALVLKNRHDAACRLSLIAQYS